MMPSRSRNSTTSTIGGETRKVISQTNRNGFFYTLDRNNGQFLLRASPSPR